MFFFRAVAPRWAQACMHCRPVARQARNGAHVHSGALTQRRRLVPAAGAPGALALVVVLPTLWSSYAAAILPMLSLLTASWLQMGFG